jgi:hypothetical protein
MPCHVHQRLLGEDLAIVPSSNLHILGLIAYSRQVVIELLTTPSSEEFESILS